MLQRAGSSSKIAVPRAVVMFLAKAFQTDIRPRQEATTLLSAGYAVFVLAWDRASRFRPRELVDGVDVRSFNRINTRVFSKLGLALGALIFQFHLLFEYIRLVRELEKRPIIHAHDFNTLLVGVVLRRLRLCGGLVYDCHEFTYGAYSELYNPLIGRIVSTFEQNLLRYPDVILTVSDPISEYLRKFNASIELVYNCPRISDIPNLPKRNIRFKLGLPPNAFIVSYVGEIRYDSTLYRLIDVARLTANANIRFLVVGGGPDAPAFRREVIRSNPPNLTVLHYVPRRKALSYMSASDLTWAVYQSDSVSLNTRVAMPWKFFDSLACGVPVVVEKNTWREQLVRKLGCGIVLESDRSYDTVRAITSLANNRKLHRRMCVAAKKASATSSWNWESMSRRLEQAYARLGATRA